MAREHVKRALEKQEEAQKGLQQNIPSEAHRDQQEAARELQNALQQLEKSQDKEQNEDRPNQKQERRKAEAEQQKQPELQAAAEETGKQNEDDPHVSEAPVGDLPEDIINEELENRKYRSVRGATGYKPVDKDW
jgi:hypothetical protein